MQSAMGRGEEYIVYNVISTENIFSKLTILNTLSVNVVCFQEFCFFAMVCLLSDFFLQVVLFVTVLSIDIRRMEVVMHVLILEKNCHIEGYYRTIMKTKPYFFLSFKSKSSLTYRRQNICKVADTYLSLNM